MNISFKQLRVFKELMRTGSVSGAAKALHRTQPAISSMLANLEAELGIQLFERRNRKLVAKPEAYYLLEQAEQLIDQLELSMRTMQEVSNLERGRLKIACLPAASSFLMPDILAGFVAERPQVSASLMMRSSKVITEWIASQQYDVGLAETPPPRPSIELRTFHQQCVCALRRDDPLADKALLTPEDLAGRAMAALYPEHPTHRYTKEAFEETGVAFTQRFELQTFLPALILVERGLCLCICDPVNAANYTLARGDSSLLVFKPVSPVIPTDLSILTPAHRPVSEVTAAFIEHLEKHINALPQL